jgi:hypothetical protein
MAPSAQFIRNDTHLYDIIIFLNGLGRLTCFGYDALSSFFVCTGEKLPKILKILHATTKDLKTLLQTA